MKKTRYFVILVACCGGVGSAIGDGFLKAVSFPKVFNDLPFISRIEVLADDYANFDTIYDNETGRCISGCPYAGITIEDEMNAIERNTRLAGMYVNGLIATQNTDDIENPSLIQDAPIPPTQSTLPGSSVDTQTPTQTPPASQPTQTCRQYYRVVSTDIPWNSPINGNIVITSDFGPRVAPTAGASSMHKGIDISVPTGTRLYATADGVVDVIRDQGNRDGGKYILLKHGDNFHTGYFHLSNNNILKVGDRVRAGDLIGLSGNTGNSTGPHLDYRVFLAVYIRQALKKQTLERQAKSISYFS